MLMLALSRVLFGYFMYICLYVDLIVDSLRRVCDVFDVCDAPEESEGKLAAVSFP